ncbi:PREDICTED: uncharacterized protein LOC103343941 [Prunus mume]|uniref:Uncharacterized protein LOC103343941 n=1 Tax=Prunus mume TaxID=102107 RepID=A0ABM0PWT3_PRUMU|nr:PREDICTED: uncharacterized protein LOC103343941 [Prunus mume]
MCAVRPPQILSITKGHNSKIRRIRWEPITFFEEEEKGIIFPHSDLMIIKADIANLDVGRILIDISSSVNVLFANAFNGLEIKHQCLNQDITPLLSFSGDVEPIGNIQLSIAINATSRRSIVYTHVLASTDPNEGHTVATHVPHEIPDALWRWPNARGSIKCMDVLCIGDQRHKSYAVSTVVTIPNGKGWTDLPDDPRDEAVTPQAQAVEDLETVSLSDTLPDQQVRTGTILSLPLRAEFITFLRANSEKWRAYDAEQYEAMKLEIDILWTIGFIRKVVYLIWLANSVIVKKVSRAWRMCQDYTNLNKACPKDSFLLPRINQLVDATAGNELLSFMDVYLGYNQIFMHHANREHTTFITDKGLYCYNIMTFGLKNTGVTYQRLVNKMFAELIDTSMEVYVDDMLVKSKTADRHLHNLSLMFGILKDYNMRLKAKVNPVAHTDRSIRYESSFTTDSLVKFINRQALPNAPLNILSVLATKQPSSMCSACLANPAGQRRTSHQDMSGRLSTTKSTPTSPTLKLSAK